MTGWRTWRAGRGETAAQLARLERLSFGVQSWGKYNPNKSHVAPGVTALFGGKTENQALGFALWRDLGSEAELLSLGVLPAAQRRGLGQALLAAVTSAAKQAGAQKLFLEVDAGNAAARALYSKTGFERVGLRRAYYRDGADAIIMRLEL